MKNASVHCGDTKWEALTSLSQRSEKAVPFLLDRGIIIKNAQTADDGKADQYKFYSLASIIAVGYRTNSDRTMQFG